jgi:heme A synthase
VRSAYRFLAMAIGTCVIIQAAAIAYGAFAALKAVDDHALGTGNYDNAGLTIHIIMGDMVIPLITLIFLGVGIAARKQPGALTWAGIVTALVVAQFLLGGFAHDTPWLGIFHGVNALLILLAALRAVYVFPRHQDATA